MILKFSESESTIADLQKNFLMAFSLDTTFTVSPSPDLLEAKSQLDKHAEEKEEGVQGDCPTMQFPRH